MSRQIMGYRVRITGQTGLMLKSKSYYQVLLLKLFYFRWSIITDQLSRPSTLCSISAFIFAVVLLIYLIMDYIQYLYIQVSMFFTCELINISLSEKKTHLTQETKQHREIQLQFYAVIQSDYRLLRLLTVIQVSQTKLSVLKQMIKWSNATHPRVKCGLYCILHQCFTYSFSLQGLHSK